ncbi:MAG: hypothetical protein R6U19_04455 [Bacteroidales bacterium]
MSSIKQKYLSHDISQRFRFLSNVSLVFLFVAVVALFFGVFKFSYVIAGINIFVIASSFMAYNTAKSLKPQMATYYFMIGFLVFAVANSLFWVEHSVLDYRDGLFLLTLLLFVNMIITYAASYKIYQTWFNLGLSFLVVLFFTIFRAEAFNHLSEPLFLNVVPIFFLLIVALIFSRMFTIRRNINAHYKGKFKREKRHLMKITSNIDIGYASFKMKYNSSHEPVDAKLEYYNQRFIDTLNLSHTSIDGAKISDLNAEGKQLFPDYLELLNKFTRKKSFPITIPLE